MALGACADEDVRVAERPDGSSEASAGDSGLLPCGASVPAVYVSPQFAANAQVELNLRAYAFEIDRKMQATENASTAILTTAELATSYTAGTPSLRGVTATPLQAVVDGYLVDYGNAVGRTWTPESAAGDAGPTTGGKYDGAFHVSPAGLDLREATQTTLLAGALFNDAAMLAAGPVTDAVVDRLVAAYGATPTFANRTDEAAGDARDGLSAALASQRDDKSQPTGPYRRIQAALFAAKATAAYGEACRGDLDAALTTFFHEWERALYASAIYFLNATADALRATPVKGAGALRSYGLAVGLIQGFRETPQERRLVTDAQIDALLAQIGVEAPYGILTDTANRLPGFVGAIQQIANVYGFSQADVESFKRVF